MRKLSPKQIEKQLDTWKRKDRAMYDEIMQLAEEQGIVLKSGKLSKAKRKRKALEKFIEQYQTRYGSYTSHFKKMKETVKKYREHEREKGRAPKQGKSYKEDYKKIKHYNDLVAEVFESFFPSDDAYEIYMTAETMNIEDAISYLEQMLGYTDEEREEIYEVDFDFNDI